MEWSREQEVPAAGLRRKLHATRYLWAISFEVVVSLADTEVDDPVALEGSIAESLFEDSLQDSIQANVGIAVEVDENSIKVVQTTRNPTPQPTRQPSPQPSSEPTKATKKRRNQSSASAGIIVWAAVAVVAVLSALYCYVRRRCRRNLSEMLDGEKSTSAEQGRRSAEQEHLEASHTSIDVEIGELTDQDEDMHLKKGLSALRLTADEKRRAVETFRNACVKADTSELDAVAFSACIKDLMNEARERAVARAEEPPLMPSEADLKAAFEIADTDRGGTVDHDEFLELYAKVKAGKVNGFGGKFFSFAFSLFSSPIPVGDTRTVEADEDRRSGREDARFQSKINESQPEIGVLSQNPRLSFNRSPD